MIDDNSLPEVGTWAEDKHARVRAYVELAAKTVGKNFVGLGKGGFYYIDPFCGAGRTKIRASNQIIDGSAMVAAAAARSAGAPFTCLYIGDKEQAFVDDCAARLRDRGENVMPFVGPALKTTAEIANMLSPHGLHFAFLDPFNIEALPFEAIANIATLNRMDILVHFSSMDLQRNFDEFLVKEPSALDSFAPGWRKNVQLNMPRKEQRRLVREHWQSLMADIGIPTAGGIEHIQGSKNQTLYWLIFAAKHKLARKFWDAILAASKPQRDLF